MPISVNTGYLRSLRVIQMSEIPKTYDPAVVESEWYQYWLEHRCFVADPSSKKPARRWIAIAERDGTGSSRNDLILSQYAHLPEGGYCK